MNYRYTVSCLRCGILYQWSLGEGDTNPEANLTMLHKKLAKHQNPLKLHLLRFSKKKLA